MAAELLLPDPVANHSSYVAGATLRHAASAAGGPRDATAATLLMGCDNCLCWEGRGGARRTSGGACNFSRSYVPRLPEHCAG